MYKLEVTENDLIHDVERYRSNSQYGNKLRTSYKLRHNNRLKRVYAICYSNCSTLYILSKGQRLILTGCGF